MGLADQLLLGEQVKMHNVSIMIPRDSWSPEHLIIYSPQVRVLMPITAACLDALRPDLDRCTSTVTAILQASSVKNTAITSSDDHNLVSEDSQCRLSAMDFMILGSLLSPVALFPASCHLQCLKEMISCATVIHLTGRPCLQGLQITEMIRRTEGNLV